MSRRSQNPTNRRDFRDASGVLLVMREPPPPPEQSRGQPVMVGANPAEGPEILVAVWDDGTVTALCGHVDLGTGIRTSLGQIVAEELDVDFEQVEMILGSTPTAPNQGATIASSTIQIHAVPLRAAAAQARHWLLERASVVLGRAPTHLRVVQGVVRAGESHESSVSYAELLRDRHVELMLALDTPVKDVREHRVVGQKMPRVDIPAKVMGETVFVHDMRVPGMVHGRVVRPPYTGIDAGEFVGSSLKSVDRASIAHIPGVLAVVVIRDFIGVVAEREEDAQRAMQELKVEWKDWKALPDLSNLEAAIRANPRTRRTLVDRGEVDEALTHLAQRMPRTYVWPYQMHASIGPSCALADWRETSMSVWTGSQNPHVLREELSQLMGLPDVAIDVIRMEASGCYGRNCADDVAADAALMSRAVGRPVRVQLTREQEHLWEPKGSAQLMEVDGGLDTSGEATVYDYQTSQPSNAAPTLALLLTGLIRPIPLVMEAGDRTSVPPYDYPNLRVSVNDMPPLLRAAWIRGVSALPSSFAHESYIDELAFAAGVDPVDYRLRYLRDERASDLVKATAKKAGWLPRTQPMQQPANGDILRGQGFAYARYVHSKFPGYGAAWAAWVADVEVNQRTGEVSVTRVVVGHDAGMMINPAGVQHQIHGNVIQTTSRALIEKVPLSPETGVPVAREWGAYPIINFRQVPTIDVVMMDRQGEPPLGAGESASVPGTAAIANAIFDATGVRFRQPPFTPEVVLAQLSPSEPVPAAPRRKRGLFGIFAGLALGAVGMVAPFVGPKSIAPLSAPAAPGFYSAQTIERGRQLALTGSCAVCHTAPGGVHNAGGRAMQTPFGTIYSTNLTPDAGTGIGRWSLSAFQRAMRDGVSMDGHLLYPAFPYTAFTKMTDDDLIALYAYLMSAPAAQNVVPASELRFPFGYRPLMGVWNALFLDAGPMPTDPTRSAQWNRGAYLVDGIGHCGACHTPRNAMGAERGARAYLSGAMVGGWEAPALGSASSSPVRWTEQHYYEYLRYGFSALHGSASGSMAPVVEEMAQLPEQDVRAVAHYLASLGSPAQAQAVDKDVYAAASGSIQRSVESASRLRGSAQRMFDAACTACHHDNADHLGLGANLPLALNSNLHSARPDNVVRVILEGTQHMGPAQSGFMPPFADSFSDAQVADLAHYMRQRFAPDKPEWTDLGNTVQRLRSSGTGEASRVRPTMEQSN